jgi:hypothetical protein
MKPCTSYYKAPMGSYVFDNRKRPALVLENPRASHWLGKLVPKSQDMYSLSTGLRWKPYGSTGLSLGESLLPCLYLVSVFCKISWDVALVVRVSSGVRRVIGSGLPHSPATARRRKHKSQACLSVYMLLVYPYVICYRNLDTRILQPFLGRMVFVIIPRWLGTLRKMRHCTGPGRLLVPSYLK